jgi:NADH-quinone oxidoreductase subunit N
LLVAFVAAGALAPGSPGTAREAVAFYLVAYVVTMLGAFGIVTVLSPAERDAERMDDYRGLFWQRPVPACVFTAMLLSLAGVPLTAGFVSKFLILTASVGSSLWILVLALVVNSAIGLFCRLRIIVAVFTRPDTEAQGRPAIAVAGGFVLAVLTLALVWLGALHPRDRAHGRKPRLRASGVARDSARARGRRLRGMMKVAQTTAR